MLVWHIQHFPGGIEHTMTAQFGLPSVSSGNPNHYKLLLISYKYIYSEDNETYKQQPMILKFEVPHLTLTGAKFRYCKVVERATYKVKFLSSPLSPKCSY